MKKLALLLLVASSALAQDSVDYRFDEVKRKVTVTSAQQERAVNKGQHAQSGDKVTTGWFSYALIAAERYRAKFEIFSSTDVQLASNTPGVILSVERGRLHAIFDKITGTEPRMVKTPGALLAVRGTQYTVNVGADGNTTLDVFEGTVEVNSPLQKEPFFVRAGQESTFSRREPPRAMPMPKGRTPDGRTQREPGQGQQRDGRPQDGGHRGAGGTGGTAPGHGGGNPPPPKPE
ncbi:MAG TPA: FecR domain-containing protein [Thermoanaerobaculia bacterium]|nr:FecR domain-containing protein [Thermoanaerobaculia bacterium]